MTVLHRPAGAPERDLVERLAKAAFLVVIALGATEQVRYRRDRAYRAIDGWWSDVQHRERDQLLRSELWAIAGQLTPTIASRIGRRP
jgi:hypothetical protein